MLVAALAGLGRTAFLVIKVYLYPVLVTIHALRRPDELSVDVPHIYEEEVTYQASLLPSQIQRFLGSPKAALTPLECQIFLSKTRLV
jgi:hypothetical protein